MHTKSRITSILKTSCLDSSVTDFPAFELSQLDISEELDFELPTNVRLGHLAESVVSGAIKASSNFKVLRENIQIIEEGKTIGEIDYLLQDLKSEKLIHMELAYKFYLYDPSLSEEVKNNWIGPNRKDSLSEKLEKLKQKQFPLLFQNSAKMSFEKLNLENVSQQLCLLVNLFLPYEFNGKLPLTYSRSITGYYLSLDKLKGIHKSNVKYHLPSKKEWGIDPIGNENWSHFEEIEEQIMMCMKEKQAPLVWQKQGDSFKSFFIVWW